jgi:hypothetical protein
MNEIVSALKPILKSQYHATMKMLLQAIERCPEALWLSDEHPNYFWHVAYNTLVVTHCYLQPNIEAFRPWPKHREGYQFLGAVPGNPQPRPKIDEPYSKAEILEYLQVCNDLIDGAVDNIDLNAPESGFPWYKMSKLEHQFVNIRHLQHYTAQLIDRVRRTADVGVDWIGGQQ